MGMCSFGWATKLLQYCRSEHFITDKNSENDHKQKAVGNATVVKTFQSEDALSDEELDEEIDEEINEGVDTIMEGLRQARIEQEFKPTDAELEKRPLLKVKGDSGTTYNILKVIGKGGFGEVYKSEIEGDSTIPNIKKVVAIKAEQPKSLEMEIEILNAMQGSIHFCRLYDKGYDSKSGNFFIVMTMLGPNLSFVRKSVPKGRLSFSTGIRVAIQMLNAIEQLHLKGFVSRDVKPSNFAIGLPTQHRRLVYMLDFGISQRYLEFEDVPVKQNTNSPWRGTTRYSSLANHRRLGPSPKDDLESWLYSVIELLSGSLPWSSLDKSAKEQTFKLKLECRKRRYINILFKKCPIEFVQFLASIDSYRYDDWPQYEKFYVTLTRILDKNRISFTEPYDWELVFEPYIEMNDYPSQ